MMLYILRSVKNQNLSISVKLNIKNFLNAYLFQTICAKNPFLKQPTPPPPQGRGGGDASERGVMEYVGI